MFIKMYLERFNLNRRQLVKWTLIFSTVVMVCYLVYLDRKITGLIEGRIWQLPAKVYSRPLELYVGKAITPLQLDGEFDVLSYTRLKQIPDQPGQYNKWSNNDKTFQYEIITRSFDYWDGREKSKKLRLSIENNKVVQLNDLYTSQPISIIRLDPAYLAGIFPRHGEDRILLRIDEVPDTFIKMLTLVEDRRFFDHPGVDIISIARAFIANIKAGHTVQGGSTITQQLVKNLFLTSKQNLWRKITEAMMAVLLELHYDKQKILETYINEIYLGQDQERAIHGFGLASRHYFGKELAQLSFDEQAVLVGMLKGASYYNPVRYPDRSIERRNVVIAAMAAQEFITKEQAEKLVAKELRVTRHAKRHRSPAFIDLVKRQLQKSYAPEDLKSEGLVIFTTLDPFVQKAAEAAVTANLPLLDHDDQGLQAAVIVASPNNGDVLAMVGDSQPGLAGFNRALDARRHIGSLIKPVIYLSALRQPDKYNLATVLDDTPLKLMGEDKNIWEPQNYDHEFHGDVLLFDALVKSYNIPAARLGLEVGLAEIVKTARELGSDTILPPYPSITLGAVDMSPYDVASIYQTFAANGFHSPLRSVSAVLDKEGNTLKRYALDVERQIDPAAISLVNYTLKKVTETGTASRLASELEIDVAGKTGTSDDLRDSWFAGFSGDIVAVTWVGYDDNRPSGLTGSSGAMRVWSSLMATAASKSFEQAMPGDITMHWIDHGSGLLSAQGCENAIELPFITGSEPDSNSECSGQGPLQWLREVFD